MEINQLKYSSIILTLTAIITSSMQWIRRKLKRKQRLWCKYLRDLTFEILVID